MWVKGRMTGQLFNVLEYVMSAIPAPSLGYVSGSTAVLRNGRKKGNSIKIAVRLQSGVATAFARMRLHTKL